MSKPKKPRASEDHVVCAGTCGTVACTNEKERQDEVRRAAKAATSNSVHICCSVCGSDQVQYAVWFSPTTLETYDVFGTWNSGDNTFCETCDVEGRDPNADLLDVDADPKAFKAKRAKFMARKR